MRFVKVKKSVVERIEKILTLGLVAELSIASLYVERRTKGTSLKKGLEANWSQNKTAALDFFKKLFVGLLPQHIKTQSTKI